MEDDGEMDFANEVHGVPRLDAVSLVQRYQQPCEMPCMEAPPCAVLVCTLAAAAAAVGAAELQVTVRPILGALPCRCGAWSWRRRH